MKRQNNNRVLFITYYFIPSNGAGIHRTFRFFKYLSEYYYWQPYILTIKENCYTANQPVDFSSYRKISSFDKIFRTDLVRPLDFLVKIRNTFNGGKKSIQAKQVRNKKKKLYTSLILKLENIIDLAFSTPDAHIGWLPFAVLKGMMLLHKEKIKIFVTTSPPHSTQLIGLILKILTNRNWIADFRDPWTRKPWDSREDKKGIKYRLSIYFEKMVVRFADRVILNTERMCQDFSTFYPNYIKEKFVAIPNSFDPNEFFDISINKNRNDKFIITHTGSLYRKRNPIALLNAVYDLKEQGLINSANFKLNFIGHISQKFCVPEVLKNLKIDEMVFLIPYVTHNESLKYIANSDVLLLIQPDNSIQVPGKLYEYIFQQVPILALVGEGASKELVEKNHVNFVTSPYDKNDIKNAIVSLIFNKTKNSKNLPNINTLYKDYTVKETTKRLNKLLTDCIVMDRN